MIGYTRTQIEDIVNRKHVLLIGTIIDWSKRPDIYQRFRERYAQTLSNPEFKNIVREQKKFNKYRISQSRAEKEVLIKSFIEQGLSMGKIAKRLNKSLSSIDYYIKSRKLNDFYKEKREQAKLKKS